MDLEWKKLAIPFRVLSTCRFCPSKNFCRIFPKCKFLPWAIELDISKMNLYSSNEFYLLLPTSLVVSLVVAKGHSSSLKRRLCEISRAFGWWWGHVSHPYLRSQSRSSNCDIKVIIKIVEIAAMAPSGIEHVFSLVYMLSYPLPFFLLSFLHVRPFPSLSFLLPYFFFLPCYCPKCFYAHWPPSLPLPTPLSPSKNWLFFFLLWQ